MRGGHVERCAFDHAVMLFVRKKLLLVSLALEGGSALGPLLALPWRKGEGRRWSTREGWHDSPVIRDMVVAVQTSVQAMYEFSKANAVALI
ncbi:hypothetical protein CDL15_Pgr009167 [Punica granatum]|uniref:Uncharacterized protein n=1 Tax=Punica granatum TaxID=22663 RepID=A0A218WK12_PUNGR|nr:hypothetical protein CDL15_Pgr009167 [Punica granatum]